MGGGGGVEWVVVVVVSVRVLEGNRLEH